MKQFVFTVKPDRPVQISLGPAFVINFIRKPKFTAKAKDGQFVIEQTDTRDEGYNLAAMLNMVPRAWSNPTFGGFFQLGVNPTKDEFGFYVGGGISVERIFSIGTGFTWQQIPLLPPSLSVGQTISSPDLLKTQREFRPGGYVTITVAVVNKK